MNKIIEIEKHENGDNIYFVLVRAIDTNGRMFAVGKNMSIELVSDPIGFEMVCQDMADRWEAKHRDLSS